MLQTTTTTTATTTTPTFNLLKYGSIPIDPWEWIDFGMGVVVGAYFPVRDHMQDDCYSGIYHTTSLLVDSSKVFNQEMKITTDWVLFGIDPLLAIFTGLKTINTCTNTLNYFGELNAEVSQYFPDWGFSLSDDTENGEDEIVQNLLEKNRMGKQKRDIVVPEPEKIDYGEASNWFLDVELEASYSDVLAYVSIVL